MSIRQTDDQWDLFICHASEDKKDFVASLAAALAQFGLRVWYDEFTLKLGDSLSRSIDKGLSKSQFGVVVLSPYFFEKDWPEYELRGLTAKEIGAEKVILPIWHNVSRADVLAFSPPLADKLAINTSGKTPLQVALAIIEVVRPELFERVHRRFAFLDAQARATRETIAVSKIQKSPVRHRTLPDDLLRRIRLLRVVLLEVHPLSMTAWVDGFRRDMHPSDEIRVWERIAAAYAEFCMYTRLTHEQRKGVFTALLMLSMGVSQEEFVKHIPELSEDMAKLLMGCFMSSTPIIEVEAPDQLRDLVAADDGGEALDEPADTDDLPREVVDQLYKEIRQSGKI
jgi:hypothetical protein